MFHATYRSSDSSTTGCNHQFMTEGRGDLGFPAQVHYRCPTCHRTHGFQLGQTFQTVSDAQRKQLADYCQRLNITDTDVILGV